MELSDTNFSLKSRFDTVCMVAKALSILPYLWPRKLCFRFTLWVVG